VKRLVSSDKLTLRLDGALVGRLDETARAMRMTRSDLIRMLLAQALAEQDRRWARALAQAKEER
jgi:predicted transcriptional regulator